MDLRIIPSKKGEFELENFPLKSIDKKSDDCSFYIHGLKIHSIMLFVFFVIYN